MKNETKFTHIGRPDIDLSSRVNPDIARASTLLFDKAEDLYRSDIRTYGRHGSAVHDALELCFNELEHGAGTSLTPSGLSACTLAIMAAVKSGDHLLLTDSVYGPTRSFCNGYLKSMGVETERYDPRIGADIETLIRDNTSLIVLESPGSLTFEIQDIPAMCEVAQAKGVATMIDNTWSGGITLKPLNLGVDMSVHAATKYIGGHSDVMFGAVVSRNAKWSAKVAKTRKYIGHATSPDDAYQILRGFRTLHTRFKQQEKTALELANWLSAHDEVQQVLHPALAEHPDHKIWQRDFTGGGCLFGVVLQPYTQEKVIRFINTLEYFGIGFSYGGYESVVIHCDPQLDRKFGGTFPGPLIRFGCGLEDVEDLKNDIDQAFVNGFSA